LLPDIETHFGFEEYRENGIGLIKVKQIMIYDLESIGSVCKGADTNRSEVSVKRKPGLDNSVIVGKLVWN